MKIDYKGNKVIKWFFIIIFVVCILGFGTVCFFFGKNVDSFFSKVDNSQDKQTSYNNTTTGDNKTSIKTEVIEEESSVINTVSKAFDSVVSIVISKNVQKYKTININPFGDSGLFNFGGFNQQIPTGEIQKQEIGGGSGFIISEDGLVVTNRHVVDDESAMYSVVLNDEKTYDLEVLARDSFNDIAICKIKNLNTKLKPLNLGDSDALKLGQTVIAIGNALAEYRNTVTKGIVSGIGRSITAGNYYSGDMEFLDNVIQTDAAINSGNSGGPLLNLSGEVVGINTAVSSEGQNIGFAIPINSVKYAIESVERTGRIIRPYIGVRYVQINESIAKANNLPYNYGVIVIRGQNPDDVAVIKNSPADKAGLKENDIILEINDKKLNQDRSLASEISNMKVGDKVRLKVYRDSKILDIELILAEKIDK